MKLGKKIRYIILPVIMLVSLVVTGIYYGIYKTQIIANKSYSLNAYLSNAITEAEHDLAYAQSYLQHKIDSKEASLIFTQNERGEELPAPYTSQFLEQFIAEKNGAYNTLSIINDFIIYDAKDQVVVHINTKDPFAEPVLKMQTKKVLDNIRNTQGEKISQYYYFIDSTENKLLNIIQVFSPYHLSSQRFYNPADDLYILQAQIGMDMIRTAIERLKADHIGDMTATISLDEKKISDTLSITLEPFKFNSDGVGKANIYTQLFDINITLDKHYFANDLNTILVKLILLNFLIIILSYIVIVKLIDVQIIIPITSLAKSIKEVEVSLTVALKPLNTHDEVSELNESYISLINKINNLANNDPLTGLSNRVSFNESLTSIFAKNRQNDNYVALFFIDLDNFKYVNDTFGHNTGDLLLVIFSERLKMMLSPNEKMSSNKKIKSIARLGGDEFVILIDDLASINVIDSLGKKICSLFKEEFSIAGNKFMIHASVGIAYSNDQIIDGELLLNQSDSAMYIAKGLGKNNYKLFTSEIADKINSELAIENHLIDAVNNNTLRLVFMPTYTAKGLELKGYEVLLRCPTLTSQHIGPDIFIPIAEKTDLILMIDLWVAENAFIKLTALNRETVFNGFFAINVSSKSLRNDNFYIRLKELIKIYDIDVKQIELEITETCLMPDDHQAIFSLEQLKSLGVSIAVDDFGTGYTSFNQLVNYPLDTLKIDRSFVRSLGNTPKDKKPTLDIIFELAKIYELQVIIEGIETEAELKYVEELPNVLVQGFYFTAPCSWSDVIIECTELITGPIKT